MNGIQMNNDGDNIIGVDVSVSKTTQQSPNSRNALPKWVYWVWLISILGLGLAVASLFIRVSYRWNVELVSTAIILTFVGLLATFIVVSNYAHVKDIENRFSNKLVILHEDLNRQINKISIDIATQGIKTDTKDITDDLILLRHKTDLYYNTLDALIHYNAKSYTSSLHACMSGLHCLNQIKQTNKYYSFENIIYFIQRLSASAIMSKIELSNDEKDTYIKILQKNDSEPCLKLIGFIEKIQIKK